MMLWPGCSMRRRAAHLQEAGGAAKEWRLLLQGLSGFHQTISRLQQVTNDRITA